MTQKVLMAALKSSSSGSSCLPQIVVVIMCRDECSAHLACELCMPSISSYMNVQWPQVCDLLQGWTPLHHAACDENTEFCELLLSYGADTFLTNYYVSP